MIDKMRRTFARRTAFSMMALLFAATLAAQTTPAPTAPTPDWRTYNYPADGFSVSYPFEPTSNKQNVPTEKGAFELRAYLSQDGEAALYVGVCDYG
ncbi:MAG: hypothetical protein WCA89_15055 [Terracidiphilus sp.]|jgi:hypothetical protein